MLFPENAPNSSGCSSIQELLASLDGASNIKTRKSWESCIKLVRSHRKDIVAQEIHQEVAWNGTFQLWGETRYAPFIFHGAEDAEERLDMVYKLMTGIKREPFLAIEMPKTRGHRWKVRSKRSTGDMRKNYFTQKVVKVWNTMPERVGEKSTLTILNKDLVKHLNCKGMIGYISSDDKWV